MLFHLKVRIIFWVIETKNINFPWFFQGAPLTTLNFVDCGPKCPWIHEVQGKFANLWRFFMRKHVKGGKMNILYYSKRCWKTLISIIWNPDSISIKEHLGNGFWCSGKLSVLLKLSNFSPDSSNFKSFLSYNTRTPKSSEKLGRFCSFSHSNFSPTHRTRTLKLCSKLFFDYNKHETDRNEVLKDYKCFSRSQYFLLTVRLCAKLKHAYHWSIW